jgi:ABC-2 type transport system permease protein
MSYRLRFISRLVSIKQFPTHNDYFAFVLVGMAVIELLTAAMRTVPTNLRSELLAGTFERMVASAYGPVGGIVALSLFPMLMGLVTAILILAMGAAVFALPLHWATVPLAVPIILLGMFAFLPIALLLGAAVLLIKQVGNVTAFLITGLALAGGAFFPISVLPSWLQWISNVQPLTPALQLARHDLVGATMNGSQWVAAGKLAAFAVVLLPISILAISRAITYCQRRGTLIEY